MAKVYSLNRNTDNGKETLRIDLAPRTMLFIILLLGAIFYAKPLILVSMFLFTGFVFMSSIKPIVNWLVRHKIPKGWAIAISYFVLAILILSVLLVVLVPFVNQLAGLVEVLPVWFDKLLLFFEDFSIFGYSIDISVVSNYIADFIKTFPTADNFKNVAGVISGFLGGGAFLVTAIVFSVYLVSEHDSFFDILLIRISADEKRERVKKLVMDVESKLGEWLLGQAVVSTLAAVFSGTIMTILGVPFALPLAIFTGFLGVIPNLGSNVAGIIIGLVALITVGPIKALVLVGAFVIYQPFENMLIVPKVMGNAVGLKPIIVMLGVISMLMLFGIVGGIVAVPIMVVAKILYEFYIDLQKLKAKGIV